MALTEDAPVVAESPDVDEHALHAVWEDRHGD